MNPRPPGYEPDELPTALLRDIEVVPVVCAEAVLGRVVPVTGLEPVQHCCREILSLLCLPFHHTGEPDYLYKIPQLTPPVNTFPEKTFRQIQERPLHRGAACVIIVGTE